MFYYLLTPVMSYDYFLSTAAVIPVVWLVIRGYQATPYNVLTIPPFEIVRNRPA